MAGTNGTTGGQGMGNVEHLRPKGSLLRQLEVADKDRVLIKSISIEDIEPDPDQPRVYFDPEKLQELADSMRSVGLLQEPAVYPVKVDADGLPTRYRLLFGERRWRAAPLAGLTEIRCKVVPSNADGDLIARLRQIDQQDAENTVRAALSAVEEAKSIKVKLGVLRQMQPNATAVELVETIAAERKTSTSTVYRLLDLLEAPPSLRDAILQKKITSREVAFQLATYWTALLKEHQAQAQAKREVQFRNKVKEWADARGLELNGETLKRYAAEQFLDPKMVRENIRTAEKIEHGAQEAFDRVVGLAIKGRWTVKNARRILSGDGENTPRLFDRTGTKGKARFTVYLDRLRDPDVATPTARTELVAALQQLIGEVEKAGQAEESPEGERGVA